MIEVITLRKGFIGYKSAGYAEWDPQITLDTADDSGEWAGLYIAPDVSVAKGYLMDSLPVSGDGISYLYGVHLSNDQEMIVCNDSVLGGSSISGDEKARLVKSHLRGVGIDIGASPLIPSLGALGYFFKGFHDPENMELIIPNKLCRSVVLMKMATYKYRMWNKVSKVSNTQLIEYQGARA